MKKSILQKSVVNGVLSLVIVVVSIVCLYPVDSAVTAAETPIRKGVLEDGVSLTFNVYEGTETVYSILEILEDYDAKATFFIGGCWADDNVECVREIFARGHEIGNHGYFHKDHAKLSFEANVQEMDVCNRFLESAVGVMPTLFAPPSGAYGKNQLRACEQLGLLTVLWSKDTIDWRDRDETVIFKRATDGIAGGDIVLMHPFPATARALSGVLLEYRQKGLRAVTVTENLKN